MKTLSADNAGFSLVEMLIVMVVMGLVMTAVYGVYANVQRNSTMSEEVVEAQQNLRIAAEMITDDLRVAGFLVPISQNPVRGSTPGSAPPASLDPADPNIQLTILTAAPDKKACRIMAGKSVDPGTATFTVSVDPRMATFIEAGVDQARIIRPSAAVEPLNTPALIPAPAPFQVISNAGGVMALGYTGGLPKQLQLNVSDMIVVTDQAFPGTVSYRLTSDPDKADPNLARLERKVGNDNWALVAQHIVGVDFTYITAPDGSTTAVNFVLRGATDASASALGEVKGRTLETSVKLRNVFSP